MQDLQFDYFWGGEAEQYSFYRIPKLLFTAECFHELSCEAKVLYGLMLDRMGLSYKNHWFDEDGRVYIIFTLEDVMELLNCARQKAVKILAELDCEKGIGLIEKKRLGLGKPNVIFLKNFMQCRDMAEKDMKKTGIINAYENQTSEGMKIKLQEDPKSNFKKYENQTSGSMKNILQEDPKSNFKKYENQTSGSVKNGLQEVRKSNSNETDINKTDINDTILSNPSLREKDPIEQIKAYRECIQKNIAYDILVQDGIYNIQEVDELVELMVEVMMLPDDFKVRIAGNEKAATVIKNRFMKLTMMHITYVLNCLHKTSSKVGNIKAYLLTALYNAAFTMEHYYQAEVNHDMYGAGCVEHHDMMSES